MAPPLARSTADVSLQKAIRAVRYRVEPSTTRPGSFQASSPAHRMQVEFNRQSVQLAEARPSPRWRLGLQLASLRRGSHVVPLGAASVTAEGNRVEYRHRLAGAGLTEWYVNQPEGLEQGFTLERDYVRASEHEPLQLSLTLTGGLAAQAATAGRSVMLRGKAGETILECLHLKAWDRTGRELPSRMTTVASTANQTLALRVDDTAAVYPVTVDPLWVYHAKIKASDGAAGDHFGEAVAIDGDTAVVGAPKNTNSGHSNTGAAYVFVRSGGAWVQQAKLVDPNGAANDSIGEAVAIQGNLIAVGGPGVPPDIGGSGTGAVNVFERTGTTWNPVTRIPFPAGFNGFGQSVAICGDRIIVGAPLAFTAGFGSHGNATVYQRTGPTTWTLETTLTNDVRMHDDYFGYTVAMAMLPGGATRVAVVGAYADDDRGTDSGSVSVFSQPAAGGSWTRVQKLLASDGAATDYFGSTLAFDGSTIVVGAEQNDAAGTDAGAAYTYILVGGQWVQEQKLISSDAAAGDYFGASAGVVGNELVIGASNEAGHGAGYYFTRSGGVWTQQQKLVPPDVAGFDLAGVSAAIAPGQILLSSNLDDDLGTDSGSVSSFTEQPPVIDPIGLHSTLEDTSTGPIPFTVSDPDTAVENLTVSAVSSVPSLVQSFNFTGAGGSRAVEIVPAPDANGAATITLTVSDGIRTTSGSFTLNVQAVNDAPSFTAGPGQDAAMNTGAKTVPNWATNIKAGPPNESGQFIGFIVTDISNPDLFDVEPDVSFDGTLTFTPAAVAQGTANVTLLLRDNGGTMNGGQNQSPEQTFRITIWNDTPPQTLTVTQASETEADLAWIDAIDHETGFRVERKAPGESDFTFLANVGANVTSYHDLTVTPHTGVYTYRVLALTPAGMSAPSNEATVLVQVSPPTGLGVVPLSADECVLYWNDRSLVETGYRIERKVSGGSFSLLATIPANMQAYADEGLLPDTTYTYRVRAYTSDADSAWSNEASTALTAAPPAAPSALTALQAGPNEVRLGWTDNSNNETGFELRRKDGAAAAPGSYARIAALPADANAYIDGGRTPGATYTYQVVAVNDAGPSAPSASASATLTIDTTKPTVTLAATLAGPPVQVQLSVRDTGSGLASIEVLTADNCTISLAPFTPGTTAPVLVTATKTNPALASHIAVRVRDLAGNSIDGDPVITELEIPKGKSQVTKTFPGSPGTESWLSVENETPGLKKVVATVNKTKPLSLALTSGQTRNVDLSTRLQPGDGNTIKLEGHGKAGSRALVVISDPPAAGSSHAARLLKLPSASGPHPNLEWHR